MPLGIAFLGISHPHCAGRMNAVRSLEDVFITGVYDRDESLAKRVAEEYWARAYEMEADLLCDDDVGLVVIESTNKQNAEFAIRCAEAGKAFLLEKPGANNLQSLRRVASAVESQGVFAQIGYHLRYSPAVERGREIVGAGVLGRVTTARFHCAVMSPWLTDPWFCDPDDAGGLVFNDFCHMLDLLTVFLGKITAIKGAIVKLDDVAAHPFEDSAAFVMEFSDVLAAGDVCGWEANDWITTWDIQLFGTEGTLQIGIHPPWVRLYLREARGGFNAGWNEWSDPPFDGELNYHREIADIAGAILGEARTSGCSIADGLEVMSWISRAYESEGKIGVCEGV
jgi:predicted dehydrogenase